MLCPGSILALCLLFAPGAPDTGKADALARGRLLLEAQDFARAAEQFERAVAADPSDPDSSYMLGIALFGCGRFAAAETPLRVAAEAYPDDVLPLEFLGRVYYQLALYDDAVAAFLEALRIGSRAGRTYNHLGATYLRMGRGQEALEAFRTAIEVDPGYAVGHYNVGALSAMRGDSLAAVYHLREAARLDPNDPDPAAALGDLSYEQGDLEKAADWYLEATRRCPEKVRPWLVLGHVCERLGRLEDAVAAYCGACDNPDCGSDAYLLLGDLLASRGRRRGAERAYRGALARDPDSAAAHKGLADLAEDSGDEATAIDHLWALARLERPDPEVLRRLSAALERAGDAAGAVAAFERLVVTNAGSWRHLLAIADRQATSAVPGIRDPVGAYELAEAVVERSGGTDPAALYVLSRAESALGRRAAAARSLERAAGLIDPERPICALLREEARAVRSDP